ncbi:MAG: glycosyl transferase family 1, partial [Pseudomonadota bacterium]
MDPGKVDRNKRILLVAETLRLSNAARLATLGKALHGAGYHVVLAADPRCTALVGDLPFRIIPIRSALSHEEITQRWRALMPLFDVATMERYVREDVRLMRTVMPDLVIGDMRPSLPISARSQGVRFAVVTDATFSDKCTLPFALPQVPLADFIGHEPAQTIFDVVVPIGLFVHAVPVNLTRLNHVLGGWHQDVRQTYTDADLVIYPNIPDIVPMAELPPTHR